MPFLFRKLTPKIHKTEKRQENHQRANMIKLWNKLSKPAAKRFDSSCIFLAGTSFSFAGFLSYNFWVFECNHFHLNIANNSTNNSLGQSNKFTKHSLHFVTPKTENFIEGKRHAKSGNFCNFQPWHSSISSRKQVQRIPKFRVKTNEQNKSQSSSKPNTTFCCRIKAENLN